MVARGWGEGERQEAGVVIKGQLECSLCGDGSLLGVTVVAGTCTWT